MVGTKSQENSPIHLIDSRGAQLSSESFYMYIESECESRAPLN